MRTHMDIPAAEHLLCDAARRTDRRGQSAGKMPAAAHIRHAAPLDKRGVIRVRGARFIAQLAVIAGARVCVFDSDAEGKAVGFSVGHTGDKLRDIRLFAAGGHGVIAALPPLHKLHERVRINRKACGQSLDQCADAVSVRFTVDRNAQALAKTRSHMVLLSLRRNCCFPGYLSVHHRISSGNR